MPLKKKPYLEPVENSSESSAEEEKEDDMDQDSDDMDGEEEKEILIDFEGRSPNQQDFHGIKQLLNQLFHTAPLNTTALTNLILDQHYVGSVLTQCIDDDDDDDDDADADADDDDEIDPNTIFGVTTAINLNNPNTFVTELKDYILANCMKHADTAIVKQIFKASFEDTSSPIGFLINERFVNIPFKISIPLFETLNSEIHRACDKKKPFKFEQYCMLLKMYRKTSKKNENTYEYVYSNPEDEIISAEALASFEFCITEDAYDNNKDSDELFLPYRKVVLFESDLLPEIIQSIKKIVE